jgi:hypothetical protein
METSDINGNIGHQWKHRTSMETSDINGNIGHQWKHWTSTENSNAIAGTSMVERLQKHLIGINGHQRKIATL